MANPVIGCSGFTYPHWRGCFYPGTLAQRHWLEHYCTMFSSVELNVTFYRLLKPLTFDRWYDETPENFVFSVKGSRFITHIKRIADPEEPLERFFSGALRLKSKLGAVLWQFPPGFSCNLQRLEHFLKCLDIYPVKNALEFRHESWLSEDVHALCSAHNTSLCMADWPLFIDNLPLTADFVYMRRHGQGGHYSSCYSGEELANDAGRIRGYLSGGRDVFIYFNNDCNGYAPRNAHDLSMLLAAR